MAQPATDAAQKARRQSGDFGTFVIDAPVLNEPPSAERQIELAIRSELTRDDFEELTGFQPEKNPATGKFEIGLYVIDDNGIRPKWSREDILEWNVSERRLIENQELRFPCTPRQLVEFMDRGGFDGRPSPEDSGCSSMRGGFLITEHGLARMADFCCQSRGIEVHCIDADRLHSGYMRQIMMQTKTAPIAGGRLILGGS